MKNLKNWDNKTWLSSNKYINSIIKFLKKNLKFSKKTNILDIGCGRGHIISALNNKYPVQQWFGQGKAGNFIQGEAFSWGKPLNIKGSPWFDDRRDIDQVFDHIGEISDYGNSYDHNVSAYGGSDKTTFYLSMSKSYEKSHWLKFTDYKKMENERSGIQVSFIIIFVLYNLL